MRRRICLLLICGAFAGPAFGGDQGTFMVVPVGINRGLGNAATEDVLAGKTFSNSSSAGIIGTMPNRGQQVIMPGTVNQPIPLGYHNGQGRVVGDPDLIPMYILKKKDLFGVTGSLGMFWGCRPGTDGWNITACGVDCIQSSSLGPIACNDFCNGIFNLLTVTLPYTVSDIVCGGNGGQ